jgi:RNA polymerase sigma-70 factor (ECF subfamily)
MDPLTTLTPATPLPTAPPDDPDAAMAAALANNLDASFEALVLAHQDRLFTIAVRLLGDARDAEEIAQDAFVRAYRAMSGYEPERIRGLALRGWLATIVINLARNRSRRRPAATAALADDRAERDTLSLPADASALAESHRLWARLLAGLPDHYRLPVVLRHVDGLSFAEIADVLGRPEGTLKAQVHRGLRLLRTAYLTAAHREELSA